MPDRYRKLVIHTLNGDFRGSTGVVEEPWRDPGPGEVAIRNHYAGCNAIFDKNLCRNTIRYVDVRPPFDMGIESVGRVVAVGPGVEGLREGDAVATTRLGSGYREYQIAQASRVLRVDAPTPETLALIPTGISALVGLEKVGEARAGDTVAVSAAAGGLGHFVVQLAKLRGCHVIGITGSVGKTSTKELLAALLGAEAFATEANLNNTIGVPLMLLRADPARHRFAVIEAGMSVPGELGVSAAVVRPDLAVVTAVEPVHLEGVGSLAGVAREKASLVAALAPGGRAIVPAGLLAWPDFVAHAARTIAVRFEGEDAPAAAPARVVRAAFVPTPAGRALSLDGEIFPLGTLSDGLARNAALALVAARELGVSAAELAAVSGRWSPPAGRGSVHADGDRVFYVDCYNSSPASLLDSVGAFDRLTAGGPAPRLFVLGGMAELGPASAQLHRDCGARLPLRPGDRVVAFGGEAAAFLQGAAHPGAVLSLAASVEEAAAVVAAHRGCVFLKGSRSHALERALPEAVRSQVHFH